MRESKEITLDGIKKEEKNKKIFSFFILAFANVGEFFLWGSVSFWSSSSYEIFFWILLILFHIVLVQAFFYGIKFLFPDRLYMADLARISAFFMPLTMVLFSLMFLFYRKYQTQRNILESFEEYILVPTSSKDSFMSPQKIQEEMQIESFYDVLEGHDLELCRDAISKLGKLVNENSIRLLRTSLNHSFPEIRLYSFYELDRISKDYSEKLLEATRYVEECPSLPEAWQELGDRYREHCELSLLDEESEREYFKLAFKSYTKAIRLAPKVGIFYILAGKTLVKMKRYQEALKLLKHGENADFSQKEYYLVLCHCLFGLGHFQELQKIVEKLYKICPDLPELEDIYRWWLNQKNRVRALDQLP